MPTSSRISLSEIPQVILLAFNKNVNYESFQITFVLSLEDMTQHHWHLFTVFTIVSLHNSLFIIINNIIKGILTIEFIIF